MNEECYGAYGRCPRCNYGLIWNNDFDYEDYGLDGEGIVSCFTCSNPNCHTTMEVYTDFSEEDE